MELVSIDIPLANVLKSWCGNGLIQLSNLSKCTFAHIETKYLDHKPAGVLYECVALHLHPQAAPMHSPNHLHGQSHPRAVQGSSYARLVQSYTVSHYRWIRKPPD